jgi:hypothetical protein
MPELVTDASRQTTLDTSALAPGNYHLAVRRQGEDRRLFPAQLR